MNQIREFLRRRWHALIALHDTPHSIAGAVAIGIFLGFTPLFGLKTLLAILLAWAFGCSSVAAAVAVNLHDVTLPFAPVIFRIEYQIGYFLLNQPHALPPKLQLQHLHWGSLIQWSTFPRLGWPTLLGSVFFGGPLAAVSYFIVLRVVGRYQRRRAARIAARKLAS